MMAAAWLAVLKAGGIAVATMPLLRARELAVILERSQASHALCAVDAAEELSHARERARPSCKTSPSSPPTARARGRAPTSTGR